jgi:hypothetical protein
LRAEIKRQQRPIGVAVLAILGVVGSLGSILFALVRLVGLLQANAQPSLQLGVVAGVLALALVILWINWGFWELIGWAWWANLLLTLISIGGLATALRFVQPLGEALAKLRPELAVGRATTGVLIAIVVLTALHLIIAVYLLSVRAAFQVGVKDERPLWERMQRH